MRATTATGFALCLGAVLLGAMPASAAPIGAVGPEAMKAAVAGSTLVENVHRRYYRGYRYARPYRGYRYRYARRHYSPYVYGYSAFPYYGSYYPYGYRLWRPGFGIYLSF